MRTTATIMLLLAVAKGDDWTPRTKPTCANLKYNGPELWGATKMEGLDFTEYIDNFEFIGCAEHDENTFCNADDFYCNDLADGIKFGATELSGDFNDHGYGALKVYLSPDNWDHVIPDTFTCQPAKEDEQTVKYGNYIYRTLTGLDHTNHDPITEDEMGCEGKLTALDDGWEIAPADDNIINNVVKTRGWSTQIIVLANTSGYATLNMIDADKYTPGTLWQSDLLKSKVVNGVLKYRTQYCKGFKQAALIRRSIDYKPANLMLNSPDKQKDVNELCHQLGFNKGTFVAQDQVNVTPTLECPEAEFTTTWTTDLVLSTGFGNDFTCEEWREPTCSEFPVSLCQAEFGVNSTLVDNASNTTNPNKHVCCTTMCDVFDKDTCDNMGLGLIDAASTTEGETADKCCKRACTHFESKNRGTCDNMELGLIDAASTTEGDTADKCCKRACTHFESKNRGTCDNMGLGLIDAASITEGDTADKCCKRACAHFESNNRGTCNNFDLGVRTVVGDYTGMYDDLVQQLNFQMMSLGMSQSPMVYYPVTDEMLAEIANTPLEGDTEEVCCRPSCGNFLEKFPGHQECEGGLKDNAETIEGFMFETCCVPKCEASMIPTECTSNQLISGAYGTTEEECCRPVCSTYETDGNECPGPLVSNASTVFGNTEEDCCMPSCDEFPKDCASLPGFHSLRSDAFGTDEFWCCNKSCENFPGEFCTDGNPSTNFNGNNGLGVEKSNMWTFGGFDWSAELKQCCKPACSNFEAHGGTCNNNGLGVYTFVEEHTAVFNEMFQLSGMSSIDGNTYLEGNDAEICCKHSCGNFPYQGFPECGGGLRTDADEINGFLPSTCCMPKCSAFDAGQCGPSELIDDSDNVFGMDAAKCCKPVCSAFDGNSCPDGLISDHDTVIGNTAEVCCMPTCNKFAPDCSAQIGYHSLKADAASIHGDSYYACCNQSCESYESYKCNYVIGNYSGNYALGVAKINMRKGTIGSDEEAFSCCKPACAMFETHGGTCANHGLGVYKLNDDLVARNVGSPFLEGNDAETCCRKSCGNFPTGQCGGGLITDADKIEGSEPSACCMPACSAFDATQCNPLSELVDDPNNVFGMDVTKCCKPMCDTFNSGLCSAGIVGDAHLVLGSDAQTCCKISCASYNKCPAGRKNGASGIAGDDEATCCKPTCNAFTECTAGLVDNAESIVLGDKATCCKTSCEVFTGCETELKDNPHTIAGDTKQACCKPKPCDLKLIYDIETNREIEPIWGAHGLAGVINDREDRTVLKEDGPLHIQSGQIVEFESLGFDQHRHLHCAEMPRCEDGQWLGLATPNTVNCAATHCSLLNALWEPVHSPIDPEWEIHSSSLENMKDEFEYFFELDMKSEEVFYKQFGDDPAEWEVLCTDNGPSSSVEAFELGDHHVPVGMTCFIHDLKYGNDCSQEITCQADGHWDADFRDFEAIQESCRPTHAQCAQPCVNGVAYGDVGHDECKCKCLPGWEGSQCDVPRCDVDDIVTGTLKDFLTANGDLFKPTFEESDAKIEVDHTEQTVTFGIESCLPGEVEILTKEEMLESLEDVTNDYDLYSHEEMMYDFMECTLFGHEMGPMTCGPNHYCGEMPLDHGRHTFVCGHCPAKTSLPRRLVDLESNGSPIIAKESQTKGTPTPQKANAPVKERRKHFSEGTIVKVEDLDDGSECVRTLTCSNGEWSNTLDAVTRSCHKLACSEDDFVGGCNGTISGDFGNCVCTPNQNNNNINNNQNTGSEQETTDVAKQSALGGGSIAGIAIGSTAFVGLTVGILYYLGMFTTQAASQAAANGVANIATNAVANAASNAVNNAASNAVVADNPNGINRV